MITAIEVNVGPNSLLRLREIADREGIDAGAVVDQAIAVWTQLDGHDERKRAGLAVMGIVVERLRDAARGAAP